VAESGFEGKEAEKFFYRRHFFPELFRVTILGRLPNFAKEVTPSPYHISAPEVNNFAYLFWRQWRYFCDVSRLYTLLFYGDNKNVQCVSRTVMLNFRNNFANS